MQPVSREIRAGLPVLASAGRRGLESFRSGFTLIESLAGFGVLRVMV